MCSVKDAIRRIQARRTINKLAEMGRLYSPAELAALMQEIASAFEAMADAHALGCASHTLWMQRASRIPWARSASLPRPTDASGSKMDGSLHTDGAAPTVQIRLDRCEIVVARRSLIGT
jgi:hypothetical protein